MEGNYHEMEPIVKTETLSKNNFMDLIRHHEEIDPRFLRKMEGGKFQFFNPSLVVANVKDIFFPTLIVDGKIVGLAQLNTNSQKQNELSIQFVSIDPEYTGRHYATKIIEEIFRFANEKKYSLSASSYSPAGFEKLKKVCIEMAKKYSVEFEDTEEIIK